MGGYDSQSLASTENWTIGTTSFQRASDLPEGIYVSAATPSYSNEYVGYLVGGYTANRGTDKVWGLRRQTMDWTEIESKSLVIPRYHHSLVNMVAAEIPGC